ncbi:TRAFAC clade GTPase domain-containing protein [Massilia sp. SYSU DXS3249]
MPEETLQIAVFGESNVGKSHYGAQLIGRLNAETGSLRMRGAAPDLAAFDDVLQSLSGGIPGAHTAAGTYTETLLPVLTDGNVAIDLNWPDYAGEQVSQLLEERRIPASWQERVETADGWILMVRPKRIPLIEDIFSRPLGDLQSSRPAGGVIERSPQARLVELLQMLLYTTHARSGKAKPALAVVLSCWDELQVPEGTTPELVLSRDLPLLSAFVRNNWDERRRLVLGLSATGVALSKDSPNRDFIYKGAEQMGWVVTTDGMHSPDLTLPISQLAKAI